MNILVDIGHPAHVHLFKYFSHEMIRRKHQVHFTVRDKEFEIALLEHEGFTYTDFGKHYKTKSGKIWSLLKCSWLMILTSWKVKPDLYLSHGSVYSAIASFFVRKPNIALEDTGNWEQVRLYKPFTDAILTSTSFPIEYGEKQIFYRGYHELAYLHPNYFTPDRSVLKELGVTKGERYFILRFVSWIASHDVGQKGLGWEEKKRLVDLLKQYGRVFISSERQLDAGFEPFRFILPPEKMHDALAFADLFVGEGATMASECAVLGTPAVYVNSLEAGTIDEQEKYGLVYHFRSGKDVLQKVGELINDKNLKSKTLKGRESLLNDKIDVTALLVWFVENYPDSFRRMKNDPDCQNKFK